MAIVIVPPMINLNNLKPNLAAAIAQQTGVPAQITGDVHFSLLGRATIVANDIDIPNGHIGSVMFTVPLTSIFDLANAPLTGDISVYDANISISSLMPQSYNHPIAVYNSIISFRNRNLEIIDAVIDGGHMVGTVRTAKHKYDIDFDNDVFFVRNHDDRLEISGLLYADGSARGHIQMETDELNRWFDFAQPHIDAMVNISMDFEWDGGRGWKFTDIAMPKINGNIEIHPDGTRIVELRGHDIEYDLSFLTEPSRIFYKTAFDLDFTGRMQFGTREFSHISVRAVGTRDALNIDQIIADDIKITGGTIDAYGAHDITINMPYHGMPAMCIFSGTPTDWKCSKFTYGDYTGAITITPEKFDLLVYSPRPSPNRDDAIRDLLGMAPRGHIDFEFADIAGTYTIDGDKITPSYRFAHHKTLDWMTPGTDRKIPAFMRDAIGDFSWDDGVMHFVPDSGRWDLYLTDRTFKISGQNFKDWIPDIDTQAFNNMTYSVSGTYNNDTISQMQINLGNHSFTGTFSGRTLTLHTDILNLDAFISQSYLDNYEELAFFTTSPVMIPFELPINISLSADTLIYNGIQFKNFVYALKPDVQTFSITDTMRGNLLATLNRNGNKYKIFAQLNRFQIDGNLLSSHMPLNVRDTTITAELNMQTHGNIAHDLEYNLVGDIDLSFDGGYLIGIGIDQFFASAPQINTFNAEHILSYALDGGQSVLKQMRLVGKYAHGNFRTTSPIMFQLRHTDATGNLEIADGTMYAELELTLRGTSPSPQPISLTIMPDGTRQYTLFDIMTNFDSTYMRTFVQTHDRF